MSSVPECGYAWESQSTDNFYLALADDSYIYTSSNKYLPSFESASYTRQMANEWGTLVLPFNINYDPANDNYRLYSLKGVVNDVLQVSEYAAGNIPAGTPLLVKACGTMDSNGKYTLTIEQSSPKIGTEVNEVACVNNGWTMQSTFVPMTAAAENQFNPSGKNVYYIAQNQFWYANQSFDMARFRAWFEAPDAAEGSAMRFQIMEVEETGIRSAAAGQETETCYDLQGRRLSAPAKGVQIVNGKLVMMK